MEVLIPNNLPDLSRAVVSEKSFEDLQYDATLAKYSKRFQIFVSDFQTYKFRPHAVFNLMGGIPKELTKNQAETLAAYQLKIDSGKGLTEKQYVDYGSLLEKKNAKPTLSAGAKTYLKKLFKEITFNRTEELKSKYLDKGIICEKHSFEVARNLHKKDYQKNEIRFENDYFTGEPDCIYVKEVIDFKSSWDYTTFPMLDEELENKTYYWQVLAYMDLLPEVESGKVIYVLNDTPDEIIYDEKRRVSWQLGLINEDLKFDLPEDLEFEIERNLLYSDIPEHARVKEFPVMKSDADIQMMHTMVKLSRDFLSELSQNMQARFKK